MASDPSDMSVGSPADQQHEQELASNDLVRRLRRNCRRWKWEDKHCGECAVCQSADTIERLERELDSERKMHAIAKAFHDVAVQQRNSAWQAGERLERELGDLTREHDSWVDATNEEVKARQRLERELAEARKEAARERGWRKIAQQRLKRANLPEPEWPIDAGKEGE